jgi:hypothetical protein
MGVTTLSGAESRQPEAPPASAPQPLARDSATAPEPESAASARTADAGEDSAPVPLSHATDAEPPQTSSDDFFDMLLAAQASGEPKIKRITGSSGEGAGRTLHQERSSTLEVCGRRVHIRTEVRSSPTFAVVTGVTRGDRAIARIETAWQHPLNRTEDRALVRRQIDLQHHQAVGMVEELVLETMPRQVLWGSQERSVDASILCRAMTAICEQLRAHLPAPTVLSFLRRSHAAASQARRVLRSFYVRPDGSVWCDRGSVGQPHDTVVAVAAWASELLVEAARSSGRGVDLRVRQLTRPMADELERLGFYRAFEGQVELHGTPRRPASVGLRSSLVSSRGVIGSLHAEGKVRGDGGVEDPAQPRGPRPPGGPGSGAILFPGRSED